MIQPLRKQSYNTNYAVAIHNYIDGGPRHLSLTVGELVVIVSHCDNWYYGYKLHQKKSCGVFPKNFVHKMNPSYPDIADNVIFHTVDATVSREPHIVAEITSVLREWSLIWKKLYMTHNPNFKTIEQKMYELIRLRSKILSGTLPVDELREIKRQVTWNIDAGNRILGLDMVVRDDYGNILHPDKTSVVELFRHHEIATQRTLVCSQETPDASENYQTLNCQFYNYTFFLSVRNIICKTTDEIEILITLYDARQCRPFTENFIIKWSTDRSMSDLDKYFNFRALFTDLGGKDLIREKVFLVCYIVRKGSMDNEANSKSSKLASSKGVVILRRPYAVAAFNMMPYFSKTLDMDEDKTTFLPILPCEKETLDSSLKKCLQSKELPTKESKGQGLVISFKLLQGDIRQVREENPHLAFGNVAVIRKMGFPEVILPGDVRNELYLTIACGEFSKGVKSADKNIQVIVVVGNEKGKTLQNAIVPGSCEMQNSYESVVYYHEDKPRWFETFKVVIPIEDFKSHHLKFYFRHRSTNENKDKNEKPFAFAFARLMQENGTTLRDEHHELLVYKMDHKKYDSSDNSYLKLASTRKEMNDAHETSAPGLVLSSKDYFIIHTIICSTKLTQNVDLLGLLNWKNAPDMIEENLAALTKVSGEEIVKFLQDVLDTLFDILVNHSGSKKIDDQVFRCLLYVVNLVLDIKYQHFQPILDLYIQDSFCATLVYRKLISSICEYIENVTQIEKEIVLRLMKCLKYVMRFVTRSRFLFCELYPDKDGEEFNKSFKMMFECFCELMRDKTDSTLLVQAACLKYLPSTIPDMITVYDPTHLSIAVIELIDNVPDSRLTKQKMMTINDLVHSPLFLLPECRATLLSGILEVVKSSMENNEEGKRSGEHVRYKSKSVAKLTKMLGASSYDLLQPPAEQFSQLELCIKIMSDIMDLLFKPEAGSTLNDLTEITRTILRTIIQTTIRMDRESAFVGNMASIMISIFRQMNEHHFEVYINNFTTKSDLLDFLMEILLVFKDLVSRPVYPKDWCEMILLQNSVILKSLRFFSHTISQHFLSTFEQQVWNNFFHCAVSFMTQPALQLERFSHAKRWRIITRYRDMRRSCGFEIRNMWFNLGQNKSHFVPSLVSPFLEMTLIPEEELRKATISIFFDMMQCEFYSAPNGILDKKLECKKNFNEFENEMIVKLDIFFESGSGDEKYKNLFHSIMMPLCEGHTAMREQGVKFVTIITRLMERLLEYRLVINDESKENKMSCTVNLLDFYREINRKEMYIRYVNKLCAMHLECDNYTEAAYTLRLHSKLLSWSDQILSPLLRSPKYPHCETHRQLKEALYNDMIAYFDKGKMWECAVFVCKELVRQYEEETFDFNRLSALLKRMSAFYDNIIKQLRPEPEYFRVAYYGRGFPPFLQNKVFVYRGKEYERISDFCSRTLNQLPNALLMNKLSPPTEDILESSGQYVQINKVEPIMDDRKQRILSRPINEQILKFHRVNDVQKFRYSRPRYQSETEGEEGNEFANLWLERTILVISYPLPGILRWFSVISSDTYLISPLQNAIETMRDVNKNLKEMILMYNSDPSANLSPLSMKLNGIVDAAVMGGINNYEKAFFTDSYVMSHPDQIDLINDLKDLIASQIPLLEVGIHIHGQRAPASLQPLQQRLEQQFDSMRKRVEEKYGKRSCDIKIETIKKRRHTTVGNHEDIVSGMLSHHELSQSKHTLCATSSLSSSIMSMTAPILNSSTPHKFGTIGALTRREKKAQKKRRNRTASKVSLDGDSSSLGQVSMTGSSASQWYTSAGNDFDTVSINSANSPSNFDLKHEITCLQQFATWRPLKYGSERAKRLTRPTSEGSCSIDNTNDSRNSTCTNESSEDDRQQLQQNHQPPPLPRKHHKERDSGNLSSEADTISLHSNSNYSFPVLRNIPNKFEEPEPSLTHEDTNERPPTPPPKKPSHHYTRSSIN